MDWFLYDKNLRHEKCNKTVAQKVIFRKNNFIAVYTLWEKIISIANRS